MKLKNFKNLIYFEKVFSIILLLTVFIVFAVFIAGIVYIENIGSMAFFVKNILAGVNSPSAINYEIDSNVLTNVSADHLATLELAKNVVYFVIVSIFSFIIFFSIISIVEATKLYKAILYSNDDFDFAKSLIKLCIFYFFSLNIVNLILTINLVVRYKQ